MAERQLGEAPSTLHLASNPISSSVSSSFARLLPANDAAKNAFHEVARRFVEDKTHTWGWHAAKYICIDIGQYDPKILVNKSKGINEVGIVKPVSEMWTGHYRLDFTVPPADPHKGWIIDDGVTQDNMHAPEILIGVRLDSHKADPPLARLVHDYSSGALTMVGSDHNTIILDGIEELRGCNRLLHKSVTSIDIGERRYRSELEPVRNSDYRSLLNKYRLDHTEEADQPPSSLVLVPSLSDRLLNRYMVRNAIGVGSTCMVYAGYDRHTGRTVAVKKFRRYNKETLVRERERIERVNAIGEHPGISRLLDIIDPNESDPSMGYDTFGVDEVYFISSPLATCTVAKIVYPSINRTYVSLKGRLAIFLQLLDGLVFLHRNGIMHRDIKPDNLAVVLPEPPQACFIDFGHAIAAASAADRDIGTPRWCAPEVWFLYDGRVRRQYDCKIDIFGLGVSMYQLFCLKTPWWKERVSKKKIAGMQADLAKFGLHDGLRALLTSCIEWEPRDRPDAASAQASMAMWYQNALDAEDAYITSLEEVRAQYESVPVEAEPGREGKGEGQQGVSDRGRHVREPRSDSRSKGDRGGRHEGEKHWAPRGNDKDLGRGGQRASRVVNAEGGGGKPTYAQMLRTGEWA